MIFLYLREQPTIGQGWCTAHQHLVLLQALVARILNGVVLGATDSRATTVERIYGLSR